MATDEMTGRLPMTQEERDAIYRHVMESSGREAETTTLNARGPMALALSSAVVAAACGVWIVARYGAETAPLIAASVAGVATLLFVESARLLAGLNGRVVRRAGTGSGKAAGGHESAKAK